MDLATTPAFGDFIPDFSTHLAELKGSLDVQLAGFAEFLAQKNAHMGQTTTKEYNSRLCNFLRILEIYLNTAMKDLIEMVDKISELMYNYDQDLDGFFDNSASHLMAIDACIDKLRGLANRHSRTLRDLSKAAIDIDNLITEYKQTAQFWFRHLEVSVRLAVIVGAGISLFCPTEGIALMAVCTIATVDQVAKIKSIRLKTTFELDGVQGCHEELGDPLQRIFAELLESKRKSLQLFVGNWISVAGHRVAYCRAQKQAKETINLCKDIRALAGKIFFMKGIVAARLVESTT
ncbi:hypothetical protein EC968_008071 [Mortierella alpina]|nr:hypothetical protein EC968_008071 [Mortierella alpina]